jgi:chromosome segregation ATPase
MDNLEEKLKIIQQRIDEVNKKITDAQNRKLTAEVHLQGAEEEYARLKSELQSLTGLSDITDITQMIAQKEIEVESIINDIQNININIDPLGNYTQETVLALKSVIDKHNIPITNAVDEYGNV